MDKPERFVTELITIPKVRDVLGCWLFLLDFAETSAPLAKHFGCLIDACNLARTNASLRKTLGIVLAVGNFLNGGSARGQADGFALDALEALASTKDVTNTITLLDYVTMYVTKPFSNNCPQV